jgi:CYTH domain-containing protein
MEIERKFTVRALPEDLENYPCKHIEQGYLCTRPVVRVRRCGEEYWLTCKGEGLLEREEYELPLTEEAYRHLLSKADGLVIQKDRHYIPWEGRTIELDVFHGPLAPLVVAEVEFPTREEALAFQPPVWFDRDVTENPAYSNSGLSKGELP